MSHEVQQPVRRPWLPLKHVIGLVAVFVFIATGLVGGWSFIKERDALAAAASAELYAANSEQIYPAMSLAMLNDDRESFVSWGEGEAREQLERIWDETKKIGWTVGVVDSVFSDEDSAEVLNEDSQYDPSRPYPDGMLIAFDLGFTHERFPDGSDVRCTAEVYNCGILTQVFYYDVTVDGGDGNSNSHRIVELAPRKPMPWDDPDGVHAVHRDNVVLFGYADEAARLDAEAEIAQTAAAAVLETDVAQSGYSKMDGFPLFLSYDAERYSAAVNGVGEHKQKLERDWVEAGVSMTSPSLSIVHEAHDAAVEHGLNLSIGGHGGALPAINGSMIEGSDESIFRTTVHEMAHALEMSTFAKINQWFMGNGPNAYQFGTEGYAVYIENLIASEHDGSEWRPLQAEVREAILTADSVNDLVGADAFNSSETNHLAYRAAGNYFTFLADQDVDLVEVMKESEYFNFPPDDWLAFNYQKTVTGGSIKATLDEWRAWNREKN